MRNTTEKRTGKRNTAAVVAILLVCILAIGGTIAYLTSHSNLTNTFTVGQISPIDPNKPGPTDPDKPIKPEGPEDPDLDQKLNGNLYEPNWKPGSKLLPTAKIAKDPYVGVGAGSEACRVFVHVSNTMTNNEHVYFAIENGWKPVEGCTTKVGDNYVSGLFEYTDGLDASGVKDGKNLWTSKPLFQEVVVDEKAEAKDFVLKDSKDSSKIGAIQVESFLHQKNDSNGKAIDDATVLNAVKTKFGYK